MKYLAAAILAVVVAGCSSTTAPHKFVPKASHDVGDPCTDMYGRSGYIVYAGDKLVCQ